MLENNVLFQERIYQLVMGIGDSVVSALFPTTNFKMYTVSLVAQWLRIRLPMQGTWVGAPVREDPTCCGATKPVRHNY